MNQDNAWSNPSKAGAEEAARMADFLEDGSQRPDQLQINKAILDALAPWPGERLLEVGSGTGVLCRLISPHVAPEGNVKALDISTNFNVIARNLAESIKLSDWIKFTTGEAEALPYAEGHFDGAWAARLLLHTQNPDIVVQEMVRVIRPGGRIVLADWDFETIAVDHPNRELTRRLLHWRSDHHGGNNWSGRQLLGRALSSGLRRVSVIPVAVTSRDENSSLTYSLWRAAEVARDGGGISPEEHDAWVEALKERIQAEQFFASITYFIVKGWK